MLYNVAFQVHINAESRIKGKIGDDLQLEESEIKNFINTFEKLAEILANKENLPIGEA